MSSEIFLAVQNYSAQFKFLISIYISVKGQTVNEIQGIEESRDDEEMVEEGQQHDETDQIEVSMHACM